MQAAEWISFIAQFAQLNRRQRQAGMALLRSNVPHDATVALLEGVAQSLGLSRLPLAAPPEMLLKATLGAFPHLTVT